MRALFLLLLFLSTAEARVVDPGSRLRTWALNARKAAACALKLVLPKACAQATYEAAGRSFKDRFSAAEAVFFAQYLPENLATGKSPFRVLHTYKPAGEHVQSASRENVLLPTSQASGEFSFLLMVRNPFGKYEALARFSQVRPLLRWLDTWEKTSSWPPLSDEELNLQVIGAGIEYHEASMKECNSLSGPDLQAAASDCHQRFAETTRRRWAQELSVPWLAQ